MAGDITRCPRCGQANRIPSLGRGKVAVCGKCRAPLVNAKGRKPQNVNDASFAALIGRGDPVVVDFWAAWCGPCRVIAPVIEALASERGDVEFAKLDVDANPATASRFRVSGIPTLVFFKGGEEKGRLVGAVGRAQIESAIESYFA